MKNNTIYYLLLTLCILPSIASAMEAGLPHQEKDPRGEISSSASSSPTIKVDKQEVKDTKDKSKLEMDLSLLPEEARLIIAEYISYPEITEYVRNKIKLQEGSLHVSFASNNVMLASSSNNPMITCAKLKHTFFWYLTVCNTITQERKLGIHISGELSSIAASHDGNRSAYGRYNGIVTVLDTVKNTNYSWQNTNYIPIDSLAFTANNHLLCAYKENEYPVIDILEPTEKSIKLDVPKLNLDPDDPNALEPLLPLTSIKLSPKGTYAIAAYNSGQYCPTAMVWETAKPEPLYTFNLDAAHKLIPIFNHSYSYTQAQFSDDEKYLAILWKGCDGQSFWNSTWPPSHILIYELASGKEINKTCVNKEIDSFVIGHNCVITACHKNESIKVWDLLTGRLVRELNSQPIFWSISDAPSNISLCNNTMLIGADNTTSYLKIIDGIQFMDCKKLEKYIFNDKKLTASQIILVKALLKQLVTAAQTCAQVTLYKADMPLFLDFLRLLFKKCLDIPLK